MSAGGWHSALHVGKDGVLAMTNTEVRNVGASSYAVDRDYCHTAGGQYGSSAQNNTFKGAMLCGETDTNPCAAPVCTPTFACCDHDYSCLAPATP